MATSPASGPSGGLSAPATIDAGPSGDTTLDLRVADDSGPVLTFSNDTWDTDPTDPVAEVFAEDTGDLLLGVKNVGKRLLFDIPTGVLVVRGVNAAPAAGDLGNSDLSLWLDDTNGASKLMVKAKSADGTVVTAAVVLA